MSSQRTPIITPQSKLNSERASWNMSRKATTSVSSSVFEDSVSEDRLSSPVHLCKENIEDPYFNIAPNCKLLKHLKLSTETLEKVYGAIMKVLNELRVHISKKQTISVIDSQGRTINTNIAEVQAKDVVFCHIDNIEIVDWTLTNNFARLWYCQDIHHSSILKQAIDKAINKSPDHLLSSKLFEDGSNDQQNQFVGF